MIAYEGYVKVSWLEHFPFTDQYSANYQHGWRLTVPSGIHRLPLCSLILPKGGAVTCPGQNRHSSWYSGSLEQILTLHLPTAAYTSANSIRVR